MTMSVRVNVYSFLLVFFHFFGRGPVFRSFSVSVVSLGRRIPTTVLDERIGHWAR